jgi:hypothetical protein
VSKWPAAGQNVTSGDKFRDNKKAPVNRIRNRRGFCRGQKPVRRRQMSLQRVELALEKRKAM